MGPLGLGSHVSWEVGGLWTPTPLQALQLSVLGSGLVPRGTQAGTSQAASPSLNLGVMGELRVMWGPCWVGPFFVHKPLLPPTLPSVTEGPRACFPPRPAQPLPQHPSWAGSSVEPAEAGAGDLQGWGSPLPTVQGRLGRQCLPFPGRGGPPSWGQPGGLGSLSSGHQSRQPCHYRQGAAEDKTPILWMGRRSRLDPATPGRLWAPCSFNTWGSRDPGRAGLPRCPLSWEGRQGWEEGHSQGRQGSARPGSQAPKGGVSRPLRPAWHPASWLPWVRCLPDSPRQSGPAPPALPARGGGAGQGSRWAG